MAAQIIETRSKSPWRCDHAELRPPIRPQPSSHVQQQPCLKHSLRQCLTPPRKPRMDMASILLLESRKQRSGRRSKRRKLGRQPNGSPLWSRHLSPPPLRATITILCCSLKKKFINAKQRWKDCCPPNNKSLPPRRNAGRQYRLQMRRT